MAKLNREQQEQKRLAAIKEKERLEEEHKLKEEEDRVNNPNLLEELEKMRQEMGGPYFTHTENAIYQKQIAEAKRHYESS